MAQNLVLFSISNNLLVLLLFFSHNRNILTNAQTPGGGRWDLLLDNIGVPAMHMQLLRTDRVVIIDRTDFGPSNISLPNNNCLYNPRNLALLNDCTAHSVEYDVASNSLRPLTVLTDTWCSSGAVIPDGTLIHTGGFNDGERNARVYRPCSDSLCDWEELNTAISVQRWYATNHILPDGRVIIVGGRGQFNYEFYPRSSADNQINLLFLTEVVDPIIENNLYPFVFLNVDGNLFIFANNRAILLDYVNGVVVRNYSSIPGGDPRSYPSSGSAVLLPLIMNTQGVVTSTEVLVCGGAPNGSYVSANNGDFVQALDTCARIQITDPDPQWIVETMPSARVMGDMVLLPNGDVLIINGASAGTAGWEIGRDPNLTPVMYRPNNPIGTRFEVQQSGSRPRMYHSTSILLRDGRVLVSGSNPHGINNFSSEVLFPTDLTLETFSPAYLNSEPTILRPRIVSPASQSHITYGQLLMINFVMPGIINQDQIKVTMVAPSFTTHSFAMNQRLLVLTNVSISPDSVSIGEYNIQVLTPSSNILAPPGYYLLFLVYQEAPGEGIWVQIT